MDDIHDAETLTTCPKCRGSGYEKPPRNLTPLPFHGKSKIEFVPGVVCKLCGDSLLKRGWGVVPGSVARAYRDLHGR